MHSPTIEILPLKKGFLRAAADATHVLVRLVAPAQPVTENSATAQRAPLDLALVIDRSGSMSGDPLKAALESSVRIIQGLRSDDRIAVVTFDDHVQVVQPLVAIGDAHDLVNRVRLIESGGSTALFDGWQEGVKQLAPFVKKERIARVIWGNRTGSNVLLAKLAKPSHCAPKPSNRARERLSFSNRVTCALRTTGSRSRPRSARSDKWASGMVAHSRYDNRDAS